MGVGKLLIVDYTEKNLMEEFYGFSINNSNSYYRRSGLLSF